MKQITAFLLLLTLVSNLGCSSDDTIVQTPPTQEQKEVPKEEEGKQEEEPPEALPFLKLNGMQLVDVNDDPVYLQGISFNNFIWNNSDIPPVHHAEVDYQRVKEMGMNVIRFYMNHTFFEDDVDPYNYRQSGWDWLDQNIEWAKKNGIYLILNMHVPQGGYQSWGEGDALWDDPENQNRLAGLWKAIAQRYKNESQIAGFGLVNEPIPTESMNQWSQLSQRLINDIRSVGNTHLLFVEQAPYVQGDFGLDDNLNFPVVDGENIVYEFHGYAPQAYTHQLLEFSTTGDGGRYPDDERIEVLNADWYTATFDNPGVTPGNSDWSYYEGVLYTIDDPDIQVGVPTLVADFVDGKVFFDDVIVKEFDENGVFVRNLYQSNLNTLDSWDFWSANGSGNSGMSNSEGHEDTSSFYIENVTEKSHLGNAAEMFEAKQGYSYQISGWMKGENIADTATAMFRLDFSTSDGPIFYRNKTYLEAVIGRVTHWAQTQNAVIYLGEFGAGSPCFENEKGGLMWVNDMYDILKTNTIHFTYHAYHEDAFGLYYGFGLPDPNNANRPLIDWFTDNLRP